MMPSAFRRARCFSTALAVMPIFSANATALNLPSSHRSEIIFSLLFVVFSLPFAFFSLLFCAVMVVAVEAGEFCAFDG